MRKRRRIIIISYLKIMKLKKKQEDKNLYSRSIIGNIEIFKTKIGRIDSLVNY